MLVEYQVSKHGSDAVSGCHLFLYLLGWAGLGMESQTLSKEDQEPWLPTDVEQEINLAPVDSSLKEVIAYRMFSSPRHLISRSILSASDVFTQSSQSCSLLALVYLSAANCDEHLHLLWLVVPSSNLPIRHDPLHPLLMA